MQAIDPISPYLQLGFAAAMAVFIFVAYERLVKMIVAVVENNTRAITELKAASNATDTSLSNHDKRSCDIQDVVEQTAQTVSKVDVRTTRIETGVDEIRRHVTRGGDGK